MWRSPYSSSRPRPRCGAASRLTLILARRGIASSIGGRPRPPAGARRLTRTSSTNAATRAAISASPELEVLEDRVALGPRRRRAGDRRRELGLGEPEVGGHARHAVAAQARVQRVHDRVVAQPGGEQRAHRHLGAVRARAGAQRLDGVGDLVARAAARPAAARDGHGQAAEDERLGERGEEVLRIDRRPCGRAATRRPCGPARRPRRPSAPPAPGRPAPSRPAR